MRQAFVKRAFDIVASGLVLFLSLPVLAAVAFVVRLVTPGPILFRQIRVGRHGRTFSILKSRTLTDRPVSLGHAITLHRDPRITCSGEFLRRWKLDELTQLWNVFRGDMIIVGPRPEVPRYVAIYPRQVRDVVLSIRPGITDLASIKYWSESDLLDEATDPEQVYRDIILTDKLELAVEYARDVSLRRDVRTILETLLRVIR